MWKVLELLIQPWSHTVSYIVLYIILCIELRQEASVEHLYFMVTDLRRRPQTWLIHVKHSISSSQGVTFQLGARTLLLATEMRFVSTTIGSILSTCTHGWQSQNFGPLPFPYSKTGSRWCLHGNISLPVSLLGFLWVCFGQALRCLMLTPALKSLVGVLWAFIQ